MNTMKKKNNEEKNPPNKKHFFFAKILEYMDFFICYRLILKITCYIVHNRERESEIGERTTGLITPNMTQGLKRSETYGRVVCP